MNSPVVNIEGAGLRFGERTLWSALDLEVSRGEFLAVLGPNGSGKTSLLRVLLGLQSLSAGSVRLAGRAPGQAGDSVGYVPQQQTLDRGLTLRGSDLVGLGLDGHRLGFGLRGLTRRRGLVGAALDAVGAREYADEPVGSLSGGEQQRLRLAQALISEPEVLLCDEPLLSLDVAHQEAVSRLIDERRRAAGTAVLFVTHEINPILPYVDKVLYLVNGRFTIGRPDEVMTSSVLSELYGTRVEVFTVGGQIHVAGAVNATRAEEPHHTPEPAR